MASELEIREITPEMLAAMQQEHDQAQDNRYGEQTSNRAAIAHIQGSRVYIGRWGDWAKPLSRAQNRPGQGQNRKATVPDAPREYIGDGAYAFFDGWNVCVETPREGVMHWVGFEPEVMEAFIRFAKKHYPNLTV